MSVKASYQHALDTHGFQSDPRQLAAVELLECLRTGLIRRGSAQSPLNRFRRHLSSTVTAIKPQRGVYFWGGVGRGKTFVMDVFFESLPFKDKQRFHFHRLMYHVHQQLHDLKGERDPLAIVADKFAAEARVLCFDEFFVSDIGDAMILGRFLEALFERGVSLVATSNIPPDQLYKDGLQRRQFLPAIDALLANTDVLNLDAGNDYRLRVLEQAEIWHAPLDSEAETNLTTYFEAIATDAGRKDGKIEVLGRDIAYRRRAEGIAWFDFNELCDGPRSQDDYIELARAFQTVILSKLPHLNRETENQARRFIALVDEFYDRRVNLIVSAEQPLDKIYKGRRLKMEFQRTQSRLIEMQTHDYLAAAHIP